MRKIKSILPMGVTLVLFIGLSLACASGPKQEAAPEPQSTITLTELNGLLKNQEVNLLSNNSLTGDQLMEVIKLCISTQEVSGVALVEENAKLSYGVLTANVSVNKIPLIVKFSCSISKTGTLKMRIIDISEQNPSVSPFSVTIATKDFDAACEACKNKILKQLETVGNTVIARSADFA